MNKLADYLISQIEERGWSQRELSRRAGLSQTHISNVINDVAVPGADFCVSVANALGEPPENLLRLAGILPSLPENRQDEELLLHAFRQLPPERRSALLDSARGMAQAGSPSGIRPRPVVAAPTAIGQQHTAGAPAQKLEQTFYGKTITEAQFRAVMIEFIMTLAKISPPDILEDMVNLAESWAAGGTAGHNDHDHRMEPADNAAQEGAGGTG